MKQIVLILSILLFSTSSHAWCIKKFKIGNTCDRSTDSNSAQNIININGLTGAGGAKTIFDEKDGGAVNRYKKGDKSKHQGYAEYKKHFIYYSYEFLAVPHQRALRSSDTKNKSYAYQYSFNPYISAKLQQSELFFKGFDSEDEYKYTSTMAIMSLRVYLLRNIVIHAGAGLGDTTVKRTNKDDSTKKEDFRGRTNVLQSSIYYIFGDENTMLGITSTASDGKAGETFNLGSSSYGLSASIGF